MNPSLRIRWGLRGMLVTALVWVALLRGHVRAADRDTMPKADAPDYAAAAALQTLESLEKAAPVPAANADLSATSAIDQATHILPSAVRSNSTPKAPIPATEAATKIGPPPEPISSPTAPNLDDRHKLAIGDRLSLRILEDEDDPKPLVVTDAGDIEAPYVGRIPAAGRTCRELGAAIEAELEKEYYYQATVVLAVDLMARSRGKVYLVGPVRVPGAVEIPSDELLTLSKAILRAGGFLDIADKKNVRITRRGSDGKGDTQFTVNVADILEKGRTEGDLQLQPGDLIFVPERLIRF